MEKFTYNLQSDETFNDTVENIFDMQQFASISFYITGISYVKETADGDPQTTTGAAISEDNSSTLKAFVTGAVSGANCDFVTNSGIKVTVSSIAEMSKITSLTGITDGTIADSSNAASFRIMLADSLTVATGETLTLANDVTLKDNVELTVNGKIEQASTFNNTILFTIDGTGVSITGGGSIAASGTLGPENRKYVSGVNVARMMSNASVTVTSTVSLTSANANVFTSAYGRSGYTITIGESGAAQDASPKLEAGLLGIYSPGEGTVNVYSGTISGKNTGIEFRDGNLNISGGVISGGTGTPVYELPTGYNGGTYGKYLSTYTNVGVVLSPSKNTGNSVNITGGTISGGYAVYTYGANTTTDTDTVLKDASVTSAFTNGTFVIYGTGTGTKVTTSGGNIYSATANSNGIIVDVANGVVSKISDLDNKEKINVTDTVTGTSTAPEWNFIGYGAGSDTNVLLSTDRLAVTVNGTAAASIKGGTATTIVGATTGTVSGLGDGAAATVSNGAISAIGSLRASGYWALGTATTAAVGSQAWTFSNSDAKATLSASAASLADKVELVNGSVSLTGEHTKWTIGGSAGDSSGTYAMAFSNGNDSDVTLNASSSGYVYAYAGTDVTVSGADASGGKAEVAKSAGVTVSGGLITAVDSLAASGGWTLGGSKVASVGSQVWTFSDSGATIGAETKAGGATKATLTNGASMTLGGVANWSVNGADASRAVATFDSSAYNKATLTATSGNVIAQTDSDATVAGSAGGTVAGLAAGAKVTVTAGTVKAIDAFAVSGYWAVSAGDTLHVGSNQVWTLSTTKNATIGNETSATAAGANRLAFASAGAATLTTGTTDLNWTVSGGTAGGTALFDSLYTSATVGASKGTGGAETISASKDVTIAGGVSGLVAGLAAEGTGATVTNGIISEVSSLAGGGYWAVGKQTNATLATQQWKFGASSANATLTNGGSEAGAATKVDFVGNKAATVSGLTFSEDNSFTANGVEWSSIGGASNDLVFDTAGNVSLGASASSTAVVVTGAAGANVSIATAASSNADSTTSVYVNTATLGVVGDDAFTLTLDESEGGISGITGLKAGATFSATNDSMFGVGSGNTLAGYVVNNGNVEDATIKVAFSDTKTLQVYGVKNTDNYGGTNLRTAR